MKILIADSYCEVNKDKTLSGHYIHYFRDMYRVLKTDHDITIGCSKEYKKSLTSEFPEMKFLLLKSNPSWDQKKRIIPRIKQYLNISKIIKKNYNVIILQSSDILYVSISIIINNKYINDKKIYLTIYNDFTNNLGFKNKIRMYIFNKAKKYLSGVITGSDLILKKYDIKGIVTTDYISRKIKGIFDSDNPLKYDILMLGIIFSFKNVEKVIELVMGTDLKVLIAGRFDSEERYNRVNYNTKNSSNITIINKYLSEIEYNEYINESRFVILPYDTTIVQSSGVYYEALINLKPVIVSNAPFFKDVEKIGIGYNYNNLPKDPTPILRDEEKYKNMQKRIYDYIVKIQEESEKKLLDYFRSEWREPK